MVGFLVPKRIGPRLMVALVPPLLTLLVFAGIVVSDRAGQSDDMARLATLAGLAPDVSGVVHELQRERGASAGFIGSDGGGPFVTALEGQRRDSDAALAGLEAVLEEFDLQSHGAELGTEIEQARNQFNDLTRVRRQVSALSLSVVDMAAYYTGTIAELLDILERMARIGENAEVSRHIVAYVALLQAKERAGQERAMGANGFAAGVFEASVHRRFIALIGAQDAYLDMFSTLAAESERKALRDVLTSSAAREVDRMREIARANPFTGQTGDISGAAWFETITEKIDGLKAVEDLVARDLVARVNQLSSQALTELVTALGVALVLVVVTLAVFFSIARGITRPVTALTASMTKLAGGDRAVAVAGQDRSDEVGDMAKALQFFKESMQKADQLVAEQAEETRKREERAKRIEDLNNDFDQGVSGILEAVSSAATELQSTSESMASIAEETNTQATTVAAASEQASTNVQTVASAAEELSSSISEIGRQVQQSSDIAQKAASEAQRTNDVVNGLADSAQKIGEVVNLITDIADQTNLLALNATIEAARAGDAGKGFAVVANEVKSLASQTAKATEDIGRQIGSVQAETQTAVTAIEGISEIINQINEVAQTIASAVEEQDAATQEIARNVQQASQGTSEVSQNIGGVTEAAREAGSAAENVLTATNSLNEQSSALKAMVERFLADVRAA
jgi:methyl-accepting chemotaxis protein